MRSFYLQSCRPTYFSNISATVTWFFWSITLSTRWLSSKESACNQGDMGSIPVSGRSPGGGHGNPLQYSYLGSPMDRGAWQTTVHRVKKRIKLKWLSTQHKYRASQGVQVLNTHTHTHTHTHTLSANEVDIRATGLILGSERSSGEGHGNPFQYSCLEESQGQRSLAGYSQWGCRVRHSWSDLARKHHKDIIL